jgi:hypothetical protein
MLYGSAPELDVSRLERMRSPDATHGSSKYRSRLQRQVHRQTFRLFDSNCPE